MLLLGKKPLFRMIQKKQGEVSVVSIFADGAASGDPGTCWVTVSTTVLVGVYNSISVNLYR